MQIKNFGAGGEKNLPVHCFQDRGEGEAFFSHLQAIEDSNLKFVQIANA